MILPHANLADIHCREYLVLLSRLGKRLQDVKFNTLKVWVAFWIHELEEKLEGGGMFREGNYFIERGRELWGSEPLGVCLDVQRMNPEKDIITGFESDIRIGGRDCTG